MRSTRTVLITGLDIHAPDTLSAALVGCDAALYRVHWIHEDSGYAEREVRAAAAFHAAARAAGVRRIVYLGALRAEARA